MSEARIHHLRSLSEVREAQVEAGLSRHLRPLQEISANVERPSFALHDATGPTPRPDQAVPSSEEDAPVVLAVSTTRHGRRLVITPAGELDMSTSGKLEAALHAAEATDAERIVIDLTELSFMDSSGLKVLLEAGARAAVNGDRLRLIRGRRRVQRVFELTDTEARLPFLD